MTPEELQEVVAAVIAALKTNGKTIDQLTAVTSLADTDNLEISNGKKVSFGKLKELVAAAVTVSAEEIKGWEMIESTDDLPEDPTQVQQEKAYVIADTSTMYVYVGFGGDTLDGLYQSLNMKGEDGAPGPPGADGHDGVDLGEVALVNNLTEGGEGSALTAEMGKTLKGLIDSQTFPIVNDLTTGGEESALSAEQGKILNTTLNDRTAPTSTVSIPFDGGTKYIKADGSLGSHFSYAATQYIPASEGDEFVYSGRPTNTSRAVAGYELVEGEYVFKKILLPQTTSTFTDKLIIIPSGITHVLAVTTISSLDISSFTKKISSTLSELTDNLGEFAITTLIPYETFTSGYINKYGNLANGGKHVLVDVKIGDEISLYDYTAYGSGGETTIGKQLTETTFEPLVQLATGTYELYTYTATEDMTIGVSAYRQDIRMLVVRRNKSKTWDATADGLAQTRENIAQTNEWVDHYDMKLGCMFENIAVIGDSMARGTLGGESDPNLGADDTGLSSHGASWLSCLAKRWGCKSKFHYAKSGTGCHGWLNDSFYGLGRFLTDIANSKVYNAYFIAYGHNDSPSAGVGTAEDEAATVTITGGVPSCANTYTFCAYYKAIINQIRANAPHAMIFCLSEYDDVMQGIKTAYRQAVIDVADWYYEQGDHLVHHLETGGVPYSDMGLGSHYSTVGYACIAKLVDNEVNRVIYQYRGDIEIKYFGSYNTDHDADSPWE